MKTFDDAVAVVRSMLDVISAGMTPEEMCQRAAEYRLQYGIYEDIAGSAGVQSLILALSTKAFKELGCDKEDWRECGLPLLNLAFVAMEIGITIGIEMERADSPAGFMADPAA